MGDEYDSSVDADIVLNITYEETQQTGTFSYFTDALLEQIVKDLDTEYGYMSAKEMSALTIDASKYGLGILKVEQDKTFIPCKLSEIVDAELQSFLSNMYDKE